MYDYVKEVADSVYDYIDENIDLEEWKGRRDELESQLNQDLFDEDSVTGNGSGSWTMNREEANGYVIDNLDLLADAFDEFGGYEALRDGVEACDVTIRCYVLPEAIEKALDEFGI